MPTASELPAPPGGVALQLGRRGLRLALRGGDAVEALPLQPLHLTAFLVGGHHASRCPSGVRAASRACSTTPATRAAPAVVLPSRMTEPARLSSMARAAAEPTPSEETATIIS